MKKHLEKHGRLLVLFLDAGAISLAYFLAFVLRFDFHLPPGEAYNFVVTLPVVLSMRLAAFYYFGLYNGIWRYASMADLTAILKGILASQIFIMAAVLFLQHAHYPRSVLIISPFIAFIFVGGIRFGIRMTRNLRYREAEGKQSRMLIYGAGDLGEAVLRDLQRTKGATRRAVCFLDDNALKHGRSIHGVPVLGGRDKIAKVIKDKEIDEVLVAVNHSRGRLITDLMQVYAASGSARKVEFKTLPTMDELISKTRLVPDIRKIDVSDLMHRRIVDINMGLVKASLKGKTLLVTGAGGTIGGELCRQIAALGPKKVVLLENHNTALFYIDKELREKGYGGILVSVPGDVRDEALLKNIFEQHKPAWVLHAAAHKHVALMEDSPQEAVKNNTLGTYILAKTAAAYNAERFLFISTDKAVRPTSVMGASKRLGEMVIRSLSGKSATKFMSVRFGNVLGSSGSVVKIFQEQILAGGPVTVTHRDVIRYFMTTEEAVSLVLNAAAMGEGGEIFVLNMGEPVKILDLARNMIVLNGLIPEKDIEIKFTGLKAGEKMYEELFRADDIRKDTGHSDIFAAVPGEADEALAEAQLQELKHLSNEADITTMLAKIKELIPTYTGWPRKSKIEDRKSKIGETESGEGEVHHGDAEGEEVGGEGSV
ncbi:MAG: nucleoside-diphosphate sugar epimerase/dehydratase [Elusimicrobiota bacterium]|nr:nucleoside-diphosphate sugar epimerase/dehydratase [Elusimicrobiota bacterium]